MEKYLLLILYGWAIAFIIMTILWFVGKKIQNYGIVDVGWGLSITSIVFVYSFFGEGQFNRKLFVMSMVMLWGIRLSLFLFITRVLNGHEDKRYRAFRSDYGNSVDRKFFTNVFQLQGILGVILSLPFLFACMNAETHIHPVEYSAFVLFLFSLFGEYLADKQLHRFKSDPANKGKVCDVGLWSMSRHPNYFFEWLIWISFALVAIASPFGFIGILSPVLMYIFLTRISGVKMTEEFAVKSRGESYLRYQKTTNAFFPWFKRAGL